MRILIFGGKGYIGSHCVAVWGKEAIVYDKRITDVDSVIKEIEVHKPDVVLNAAGERGKPNVDWCEDHPIEVIEGNVFLPITIARACQKTGVYFFHIGTGCIFYGDAPYPDKQWREYDPAFPITAYSKTKFAADLLLSMFPHTGIGRIRLPISFIPSTQNFLTKITSFKKVSDVANDATILTDFVPVLYALCEKRAQGIFHLTNRGPLSFRRLIELYEKYVDPRHTCEFVSDASLNEQGINKKQRSNCVLASQRLETLGLSMRPIEEALIETLKKYKQEKEKQEQIL